MDEIEDPFDAISHKDRPDDFFCSLRYLLIERQIEPAAIASAIEQVGIFGIDRYGRFKQFSPESADAVVALDALSRQFAWQWETDVIGPDSPAENDDDGRSNFSRYGWSKADLPQFEVTAGNASMVQKTLRIQSVRKVENTRLRIIAALLHLIEGRVGTGAHPDFDGSRSKLVDLLAQEFPGVAGLSARHLRDTFPIAEQLLRESDDR